MVVALRCREWQAARTSQKNILEGSLIRAEFFPCDDAVIGEQFSSTNRCSCAGLLHLVRACISSPRYYSVPESHLGSALYRGLVRRAVQLELTRE